MKSDPEFAVLGVPTPMVDAREKVQGASLYAADISLPQMLTGKILRSTHAHARLISVDVSAARTLPGVKAILTRDNILPVKIGIDNRDLTVLALDKVRFIGEEVAAVAAVDEDTALEAIDRIRVEYEILPAVFEPEEALTPNAPLIHEDMPSNLAHLTEFERGDVERGFREAAAIYENTFHTPVQYQGYMEPMGTIARPEPSGKITVWTSTQSVFFARDRIAEALGVTSSKVRVIQPAVGGGFGGKLHDDPNASLCALLAAASQRPVRLINDRTEDFLGCRPRVPTTIRLRLGIRRNGTLCAKETDILADNGAATGRSVKITNVTAMRIDNCYRLENVRTRARLVYTNKLPTGAFRGFGNPQITFAFESALDHVAEQIGMDPVEIRKINAIRPGETSVHGWKMGSCGLQDCMRTVTEASRIRTFLSAKRSTGPKRRGFGIANSIHVSGNRRHGGWDGATAAVKVNPDGRVNLLVGEGDVGQGSSTVLSLICAEELGLRLEDVEISQADTDLTPLSMGSSTSRLTFMAGNAVKKASAAAKSQLLKSAGELLEVNPADLTARGGFIFHPERPGHCIPVAQACQNHGEPIFLTASVDNPGELADATHYGNISPGYTFCTQVAEVEVDTETGEVALLGFWAADDVGRTLNPLTAHGQVQGAIMQGIGFSLCERWISEGGQTINGNLADYALPKAPMLPVTFNSFLIESREANGPFGAKAASETAIDPTAAAIANAVYNATGVRLTSLPLTPERILAAWRASGRI